MAFVIMSYKKIMNNFEVIKTPIKDLVVIQPKVFGDERGFFLETYNKKSFEEFGIDPSELIISDKDTKHQNFDRNKKYFKKY